MPLAVNQPSREVEAMRARWGTLEALLGGTPKMREAAKSLLPQMPAEEPLAYAARLATATLYPAYRRTVAVMSGKPFAKPLDVRDADPSIEAWIENIDMQGVNLHGFAAEMFRETLGYGFAGVLVDYPDTTPRDAQGNRIDGPAPQRTVAQVEAAGLRPYFIRVMHNQILGWRTANVGGRIVLTQLRLAETAEEPDGDYGVACIEQVRVLFPGGWEVWRKVNASATEWALHDSGSTTLDVIPFVPFYGIRESFMCGAPPMEDIGHLNVKHWQSQSDQDTIMHAARVPILTIIGADDNTRLVVGGSAAVNLPPQADMKWVEHSGAAIGAGEASLRALEEQMIQAGAELIIKNPAVAQRTATQDSNEAEANKCDLQRMAESFEDALDQALAYMARFAGIDAAKAGSVKLFSDYGAATMGEASAQLIKDLHIAGLVSGETALAELQRRGVLDDEIDPVEEWSKAQSEVPATAPLPANGGTGVVA